ncbi:hypothetical protein E4U21_002046 [Claviceps maximensis]|nr:hypothetical protein E4U21_002046 [Claviceps maximensis]
MEANAIELSPLLDSCAADSACIFDAADHPCENDKERFSTSTSISTSTSTSESGAFGSCPPNHSPSSPVLMQAYANRPLPRLPSSAYSLSESTRATELQTQAQMAQLFSTEKEEEPGYRSSAFSISSMPLTPQYHGRHEDNDDDDDDGSGGDIDDAIFSIASQAPRSSFNSMARSSRRSSQKVHQLIGLQLDVMDNQMVHMANAISDLPSATSNPKTTDDYGIPDYCLVPVLEADDDKTPSRGSSWGPMSPETDAIPAPLHIHKSLSDGNCKKLDGLSESFLEMDMDDDTVLPWESAHGQFSDIGAAGEYHRFTADLATRHSRQSRQLSADSVFPPTASSKKKRSSLGLNFSATALFSRRRERFDSVHYSSSYVEPDHAQQLSPKSQRQSPADFVAGPAYPSAAAIASNRLPTDVAPPRPPPAPPLRSAWDSDSDTDDLPAMSTLKDWFAHRAGEEMKGHRRISSGSRAKLDRQFHVPTLGEGLELLARRQEREKQIKREKAAKRRASRPEELKRSFSMIPKELGFSSSRFT